MKRKITPVLLATTALCLFSATAGAQEAATAAVKAQLKWQGTLDVGSVAAATGRSEASVLSAMGVLAAQGVLGFDLQSSAYFHRVLPFDLTLIEKLNPRLKSANALLRDRAVTVHSSADAHSAEVESNGVVHRVSIGPDGSTCTCPWYAKHQGSRGPCKHVLATEMALDAPA